jgi:ferredoxin-NADP reductase/phenylpropionate dioxygenase-like ring-hydroxylating dioxygenase large terminal subunit/ferredoxin
MSHDLNISDTLLAGIDSGRMLPGNWYTDPEITERELQQVFAKSWAYVGPANDLRSIGDFITGYIGGRIPVAVVRDSDGLNGLVNICRHRRHEVMKGRGNVKALRCGYHGWTYNLAGRLQGAPRTAGEPGFRLEDYPLLPLRAETLGPWVFVNADRGAPPVREQYGKVLDIIAQSGVDLDSLVLHSRDEWESYANWKTMLENFLECYHCAIAHPGFSAAIDVMPDNYNLAVHGWFSSQVGMVRQSALEGRSQVKIYDARGEVAQAQYHLLFPNMTVNVNPGFPNLSIDVWWPNGPNGTKGFSEQYFGPGVSEEFARELIEFNRQVGAEDDDLTNSVQRGLRADIVKEGRYLTGAEHLVGHFQRLIVHMLEGNSAALAAVASVPPEGISHGVPVEPTASAVPEKARSSYTELEVIRVERESDTITSFYLRPADGGPLHPWQPGQFLPIRVTIPGQDTSAQRTYTLSCASNPDHYRLSIRRGDGAALVSQFLHANAALGFKLEGMAPRGRFVLAESDRPVVLVSGGVGLTPMIAMAEHIVAEGRRTGRFRPIYFIHGTRNGRVHAFRDHVRALAAAHPQFKMHVSYSHAGDGDAAGASHDADGTVSLDTLKQVLPFGDHDFYLCGPTGFMRSLYEGLTGMGIATNRIFYESFGPATVLKREAPAPTQAAPVEAAPAPVRFVRSDIGSEWSRERGTLLEFAESLGIAPQFSCRSGICGTCATPILGGAVDYLEEPVAPREASEVLLCCSVPRPGAEVVLDI